MNVQERQELDALVREVREHCEQFARLAERDHAVMERRLAEHGASVAGSAPVTGR